MIIVYLNSRLHSTKEFRQKKQMTLSIEYIVECTDPKDPLLPLTLPTFLARGLAL